MKTAKFLFVLVTVAGLAVLSLAACGWQDWNGSSGQGTPQPGEIQAYELTAVYGAGQLHVQLTALARLPLAGNSNASP